LTTRPREERPKWAAGAKTVKKRIEKEEEEDDDDDE